MKNSFILLYTMILLSGCEKEPIIKSYSLNLKLKTPSDMQLSNYEGIKVELINTEKDYTLSAFSNEDASVYIQGLEAGLYQLTATHEATFNEQTQTLNGISSLKLTDNTSDTLQLFLGNPGNFIIREYYYSGSTTSSGGNTYASDQYIEIYNNTNKTLYADGLSVVEHESLATSQNYWQYIEKDSIVVKTIWSVPGTGKDYPIMPGHGFIVARNAFNHRSDPNGNPLSPVNLGDAEFEFWSDATPNGDIDFAASNMVENFWVYKGKDMSFHTRGASAIALAWLPKGKQNYILENLVAKVSSSGSSKYFCKIHNSLVEDAVETMWNNRFYKRFHNSLDAGYVAMDEGAGSGLCVRRKIKEKINGRTVYMDTNNSSIDFEHDIVPAPRNYDK